MDKNKLALAIVCTSLLAFMHGMTPNKQLLKVVENWDLQQAQEALDAGADVNYHYEDGICENTALHRAAQYGNAEMVKFLLEKGATVTTQNKTHMTPLHYVGSIDSESPLRDKKSNYLKVAKLLLAAGAHINAQDNIGITPLHRAVIFNEINVIKLLIEHGARTDKALDQTTLSIAKMQNNQKLITLLNTIPSLKYLSAWALVDLIKQNKLTLEQVKDSVPEELYEFVIKQL